LAIEFESAQNARFTHRSYRRGTDHLLISAAYPQDSGFVDGRVGPDLSTSPMQSNPAMGPTGAYRRPFEPGPRAGFAGVTLPGQTVPENVSVFTRQDGSGTAFVNGHRVIVSPNSNRILGVVN
jgi:hypothetical protein